MDTIADMSMQVNRSRRSDFEYKSHEAQGRRLCILRIDSGLQPDTLAASAGITTQQLFALEAGLMMMTPDLASRMARKLGVQYTDLWLDGSSYEGR
jgi:DNA-binding XRE family transcriptional regulator